MNIITFILTSFIIFNSLISSVLSHTCVCAEFTKELCNAEPNCCWNENVPQTGPTNGIRGKCRSVKYLSCKVDPLCSITYNIPTGDYEQSFVNDKVNELVSAYNKLHKLDGEYEQNNGVPPEEGRVLDWPWVCGDKDTGLQYTGNKTEVCKQFTYKHYMPGNGDGETGSGGSEEDDALFYAADNGNTDSVYAADPVDVSQIEIAAQRLYYAKLEGSGLEKTENNISSKPGTTYQAMSGLQIGAGVVFIVLLFSAMCYWQCNKDKMDKDNKFISLSDDGNTKGTYATFDS